MFTKIFLYFYIFKFFWYIILAQATLNLPPSITVQNPTDVIYFDSGVSQGNDVLQLPCKATGSPNLIYTWKLNDTDVNTNDNAKYILDDGNLIFVRPVQKSTTGIYQCLAKNTYGTAISNKVSVRLYQYPVSSTSSVSSSVIVGSSYRIQCTSPSGTDPKPIFTWQTVADFKDSNPRNIVLDRKIRMDENGTLYFSSIEMTDGQNGRLYRCQIQNPDLNSDIRFVGYTTLTVSNPTNPSQRTLKPMFKSFYPIIPLVGTSVTLYCFFEGATDIDIAWELPSGNTPSGTPYEILGNTLRIKNLTKADSGDYACVGTSLQLANSLKQILTINVKEKPVFLQQPYDKTSSQGTNIVFNCTARADPPALYTWFRNGVEIIPGQNLRSNLELSADKTQLTIKNICKDNCLPPGSDLAVYQCKASNDYGSILANGYVGVLVPTIINFISKDILYDPKVIPEFTCTAITDEATMSMLTYTWLFNGQMVNNGKFNTSESVLKIPLSESSKYIGQWSCNASDSFSNDIKMVQLYQAAGANVWPYWWIPLLVIIILLILILLVCIICCCLYSNRGDAYPIDDIEKKVGNNPEKELIDSGFHDYQRQGLLPRTGSVDTGTLTRDGPLKIKRNPGSLSGSLGKLNSDDDSLAYSNINPTKFNEDGSFIDRYNTASRQTYA